jgi:hypothetical protein
MDVKKLIKQVARSGSYELNKLAVKILLGMYIKKPKVVAAAIYGVTDAIATINTCLRMNEYLLAMAVDPGANVWHTAEMKSFKEAANKHVPDVKLDTLLGVEKTLVDCRTKMQGFIVGERSMLLASLT